MHLIKKSLFVFFLLFVLFAGSGCVQIGGEPEEIASGEYSDVLSYVTSLGGDEKPLQFTIDDDRYCQLEITITTSQPLSRGPRVFFMKDGREHGVLSTHARGDTVFVASGREFGAFGAGEYRVNLLFDVGELPDSEVTATISYSVKLRGLYSDLIMYCAALLVLILITVITRSDTLARLTFRQLPTWLSKSVIGLSALGLLILIVDELGLALLEWGIAVDALLIFRDVMAIPGVSYTLFWMNMILLFAGMWEALDVFDNIGDAEGAPREKLRKLKLSVILVIFSINLTIMGMQLLIYNGHFSSLQVQMQRLEPGPEFLLSAGSFLAVLVVFIASIKMASGNMSQLEEYSSRLHLNSLMNRAVFFGVFVVLSETMITKAALLLILIPRFASGIKKAVGLLLRGRKELIGLTGNAVKIREIIDTGGKGFFYKLGFLWLIGSSFPLMLLYQVLCSPFPPLAGPYPMSTTISLLYSVDLMILIAALAASRAMRGVLVVAGIVLQVAVRYLFPVVYPDAFTPAPIPPGANLFDMAADFGISEFGPALALLGVHLIAVMRFWLVLSNISNIEEYNTTRDRASLGRMIKLGIIGGFLMSVVLYSFASALVLLLIIQGHNYFGGMVHDYAVRAYYLVMIFLLVFQFILFSLWPEWRGVAKTVSRLEGGDSVERYGREIPWLKYFGWPHKGFVFRAEWIYLIASALFWGLLGYFTFM